MSWDEMYRSVRFLPKSMAKYLAMEKKEDEMEKEGGMTYKKAKKAKKVAKKSKMK